MIEITDPKELEYLKSQEQKISKTPSSLGNGMGMQEITDPKDLDYLKSQEEGTLTKYTKKILLGTSDFFSGTKRTEFPDVPELSGLGEYGAGAAAKIIAGVALTPNQKAQAQIIQAQIPGTKIVQDKFDNPMAVMPDGKTFYLNKPVCLIWMY